MLWFTGDEHYHHGNIIGYCDRPFASSIEMDETLIRRHNEVVSDGDVVYHLGDFAYVTMKSEADEIIDKLNGRHIFIKGSHDRWLGNEHPRLMEVYIGNNYPKSEVIVLCHYAMRMWSRSHYGSIQLYGHSHGRLAPQGRQLDVGVDCWNFYPVSLDTIRKKLSDVPIFNPEQCGTYGNR
jgi:calcineurin-like phosphoesterase family protein